MRRANSLEKTLMLRKIEDRRRRGQQRTRWLDGIINSNGHEFEQTLGDSEGQGILVCCRSWGCKESDTTEWLNNNGKVIWIGSSPIWLISVWEEEIKTQTHVKTQGRDSQGERTQKKLTLTILWSWTSHLQNYDKINIAEVTQMMVLCYGAQSKLLQNYHK